MTKTKRGDETFLAMKKFWGKLFLINFALGVVTGITLEFQFGTNWSRYSACVGDIFGSLLAIEASVEKKEYRNLLSVIQDSHSIWSCLFIDRGGYRRFERCECG